MEYLDWDVHRGICGDVLSKFSMSTAMLQEMLKGKFKGLSKSISSRDVGGTSWVPEGSLIVCTHIFWPKVCLPHENGVPLWCLVAILTKVPDMDSELASESCKGGGGRSSKSHLVNSSLSEK